MKLIFRNNNICTRTENCLHNSGAGVNVCATSGNPTDTRDSGLHSNCQIPTCYKLHVSPGPGLATADWHSSNCTLGDRRFKKTGLTGGCDVIRGKCLQTTFTDHHWVISTVIDRISNAKTWIDIIDSTRCPKKNCDLLYVIVALNPSLFWTPCIIQYWQRKLHILFCSFALLFLQILVKFQIF